MIAETYNLTNDPSLLPCPFCGEREYKYFEYDGRTDCFFQCDVCTCTGPNGGNKDSAVVQWNSRPSEAKIEKGIRSLVYAMKRAMGHKTASKEVKGFLSTGLANLRLELKGLDDGVKS